MKQALWGLLTATLASSALADAGIGHLRWEARPILVFATEGDARLDEQIARFDAERRALEDRDNVVIVDTEPGSALRARYSPSAFTVILIGKDGGEKFRRDGLVSPSELHALIDTMPMRQQEMRRGGQ